MLQMKRIDSGQLKLKQIHDDEDCSNSGSIFHINSAFIPSLSEHQLLFACPSRFLLKLAHFLIPTKNPIKNNEIMFRKENHFLVSYNVQSIK